MDLQNNSLDGHSDIAQFLQKFKDPSTFPSVEEVRPTADKKLSAKPTQYEKTFEKLEQKIEELEARFDATAGQNQLILAELARQREVISNQQDRDAFLDHLSHTIANLRASVENLSRAQQSYAPAFPPADVQRGFDNAPRRPVGAPEGDMYQYEPETYRAFQERRHREAQAEKERIIASLHQKASQLKAVNSALDREIKKVQQEKMAALKKSAEQAKEILSLREQLTAAEEKFKSFDFEGRIISVRQEYEQKVSSLETQLQEISATCMKQVEEIESLRAQNVKLQHAAAEKEQILARLQEKEAELAALKAKMADMEQLHGRRAEEQLAKFSQQLQAVQTQRDELAAQSASAQEALEQVRGEKELIEKNFKELLEKINQNDAVIEHLKEKIEVLGKQNKALSEQNSQLTEEKERWANEKVSYEMRARSAEQDREVLMSRTQALSHAKETVEAQVSQLAQANAALTQEKNAAQARAHQLAGEKQSLSRENEQLRNQSAALLASRVVKEKEHAAPAKTPAPVTVQKVAATPRTQNTGTEKPAPAPVKPSAAPAAKSAAEKPAPAPTKAPAKTAPAPVKQAAPETAEAPLYDGPVTITDRAKVTVTTDADLPEIKVAKPNPQPENTFDGDDFLMTTDSFWGRMRWSLFRDDK